MSYLKIIGCLNARHRLKVAAFNDWNHCDANESSFPETCTLLETVLFLLPFMLFFLLVMLVLDFFSEKVSSSRELWFPFTPCELLNLDSAKASLSTEFSSTKPHDNNCMDGSIEKRRKIVCISKLDNANPPVKLPHMPPKAIANHDTDWRSPANEALTTIISKHQGLSLDKHSFYFIRSDKGKEDIPSATI